MTGGASFAESLEQLERLLLDAERELPAPALRTTRQVVAALLDAHRAGLSRLLERVGGTGAGAELLRDAAEDGAVAALLALHGLHPEPIEARVRRAVDEANVAARKAGYLELRGVTSERAHIYIKARNRVSSEHIRALAESALGSLAPELEAAFELEFSPDEEHPVQLVPLQRLLAGAEARR
jgi:hypothetical protein